MKKNIDLTVDLEGADLRGVDLTTDDVFLGNIKVIGATL